jgi:hypothetical protein
MSLSTYRAAVVAGIEAAVPAFRSVEPHGGRFDLDELKRFGAAAPAARVALLGVSPAQELASGAMRATVRAGVFVLTRDAPALPRDVAALVLVDGVLQAVRGNLWGLDTTERPQAMRADNLFGTRLAQTGIDLWAVSWEQRVHLGGLDAETLDLLETIQQTWPVGDGDTTDPQDTITLPQS